MQLGELFTFINIKISAHPISCHELDTLLILRTFFQIVNTAHCRVVQKADLLADNGVLHIIGIVPHT